MAHPLEIAYGLTATEILDAVSKRFRLRAALEGAVAEVQMDRKIQGLLGSLIARYEAHDLDGQPDFSIWLPGIDKPLRAECKNIRESSMRAAKPTARAAARKRGHPLCLLHCMSLDVTRLCENFARYNRTRNFEACGHAQSKKTQKFILRSLLRPNQFSFSHSLDPEREAPGVRWPGDSRRACYCALLPTSACLARHLHQEKTDEDFNLLCRGDLGCGGAGDAGSRRECSRLVRELGL